MSEPPDSLPGRFGGFRRAQQAERPRAPDDGGRRFRLSAKERGYDWPWQKLSRAHQQAHPWCEECERRGREELGVLRDHIIPIADRPDLRLDPGNVQNLCQLCHDIWKRRLEAYARDTHQVDLLPMWVRRPETRPQGFEIGG